LIKTDACETYVFCGFIGSEYYARDFEVSFPKKNPPKKKNQRAVEDTFYENN